MLNSAISFSQVQQFFFVDDVDVVEHLWVKICIGDNGETVSVEELTSKTTYGNKDIIGQIIDYRKGIDFYPDTKYKNSCFDYAFNIVNSKYQSLQPANTDCENSFATGTFRYLNPEYRDTVIKRRKKKQIERTKGSKSIYNIKWISPCNYVLTYSKVSNKEHEYLIGQKIDVKIIDVLDNGRYVYYSNLGDRTYGFGEMEKY